MQERGGVALRFSPTEGMQSRHAPFWKLAEAFEEGHTLEVSAAGKPRHNASKWKEYDAFASSTSPPFPFPQYACHFYKSTKSHLKEQLKKQTRDDENNRAEELTYMKKI